MQINDHANKINSYILNTQKEEKESKENKNFIEFKFTQGVKELEKNVKDNQNNSESEDQLSKLYSKLAKIQAK
ncbi:hypothetical protein [Campylobacter lari]|uniref:hypothetical protein n=1 Tax=Campylobacter lari TaxID=201 RepID=UPI0012720B16|nr:hypothetical protein [Campylobacter lari]EAK5889202.1 hypothetical protein [Campylobacter lari]EGK8038037.1 hypothetical protein [Campylobacter lari]MCH3688158.1 hypothetical protein [Campylobacter lari]